MICVVDYTIAKREFLFQTFRYLSLLSRTTMSIKLVALSINFPSCCLVCCVLHFDLTGYWQFALGHDLNIEPKTIFQHLKALYKYHGIIRYCCCCCCCKARQWTELLKLSILFISWKSSAITIVHPRCRCCHVRILYSCHLAPQIESNRLVVSVVVVVYLSESISALGSLYFAFRGSLCHFPTIFLNLHALALLPKFGSLDFLTWIKCHVIS